jgi:hypothetical protein
MYVFESKLWSLFKLLVCGSCAAYQLIKSKMDGLIPSYSVEVSNALSSSVSTLQGIADKESLLPLKQNGSQWVRSAD